MIYEDKVKKGRWQVAWTWLPFFLSSNRDLHKFVAQKMTEEFRGSTVEGDVMSMYPPSMTPLLQKMHDRVISLILEKHPIPGLRQYLEAIIHVHPEEDPNDVVE